MEETAFSDLECTFDEKEVIVVDTGSGFTKVGYSGCDVPARVIPTAAFQDAITRGSSYDDSSSLGRNTSYGSRSSTAEAQGVKLYGEQAVEAYVNSSSHHPTARKELRRPILRGEIIDKDDLEAFWDHTLRQIVRPSKRGRDGSVSLEDFPVLLTDCPSSTAVATASNQQLVGVGGNSFTRAWMAEVMFEKFHAPAVAIMNTAALSLFATGMPTGLVVDIGEGVTHATPVFQGFAIPHATFRLNKAGMDVTEHLREIISQRQPAVASKVTGAAKSSSDYFIYADMKEKFCQLRAADVEDQDRTQAGTSPSSKGGPFELPDGSIVQVDGRCCLDAPEVLFCSKNMIAEENGEVANSRADGTVASICQSALEAVDPEIRPDVLDNIYVSGGSSMLPGVATRLENALNACGIGDSNEPVTVRVDSQRKFWLNNRYGTTEELKRLAYGPLIGDILDDLSIPGRRFSLYLGHDTGPANSLTDTLKLTWLDSGNACAKYWPPFGTTLVLEIYSDNQARWIYNGRVTSVEAIEECRGKSLCNYDSLYEYMATIVPNEFECKGIPEPRRGGLRG